jgi:ATP/maltotriose-dependent transcriptional regulator MalT
MLEALSPQSEVYAVLKGEVSVLQSLIEMILDDAESGLDHAQEGLNDLPENAIMIRSLVIGVLSICHQMMGNTKRADIEINEALSNPI